MDPKEDRETVPRHRQKWRVSFSKCRIHMANTTVDGVTVSLQKLPYPIVWSTRLLHLLDTPRPEIIIESWCFWSHVRSILETNRLIPTSFRIPLFYWNDNEDKLMRKSTPNPYKKYYTEFYNCNRNYLSSVIIFTINTCKKYWGQVN